jgi:hypothetical protein
MILKNLLLLLTLIITQTAHAGFPQGSHEKMYKDVIQFKSDQKQIINGVVDPTVTATPGDAGSLLMGDNGKLYVKQDNGTSTNWDELSTLSVPAFTGEGKKVLAVNAAENAVEYVDVMKYNNNGLKNLFVNPSAEEGSTSTDWSCTNGFLTTTSTNPMVTAKSGLHFSIGSFGAGECVFTLDHSGDYENNQGLFSGYFNVSNNGIAKIQVLVNEVLQTELDLTAATHYKKYEIPFVFGDGANGSNNDLQIKITYTGAVTVLMDEIYAGLAPKGYIQQVGQAHFVGKLRTEVASCVWLNTTATWDSFPVDNDCTYTSTGDVLAPTTNIPAVKIPNARTDGYYRIKANATFVVGSNPSEQCGYTLSTDGTYQGEYDVVNPIYDNSSRSHNLAGDFRFNSSGDKQVEIISTSSAGADCYVYASATLGRSLNWSVHFYPDSNATIVSQNTELDETKVNEFSARINDDGTVESENFDFIDGDCTKNSTGNYTCNFNTGLFTQIPSVTCTGLNSSSVSARICEVGAFSTSSVTFLLEATSSAAHARQDANFEIKVSRQSTDVKKSATIIGKFENINDSETCEVFAANNDGTAITANTSSINWVEQDDTCGLFNGTQYVSNKDVTLSITGQVRSTAAPPSWNLILFRDGVADINLGFCQSDVFCDISKKVKTTAGEVLTIRSSDNFTLGQSDFSHTLQIKEMPSTAAVVKNLLAESSQTKCQTKYLASDLATGTGNVSGLTFNGLTVGKKYSLNAKMQTDTSGTGTQAILDWFNHPSTNTNRVMYLRTTDQSGLQTNVKTFSATNSMFTAQETTLRGTRNITANVVVMGNGTIQETYVQLCQLPDTYVETTEW